MIPLTVIGGFLGAGKTTLVNHLLATGGKRWGVLVNDFGAINVDAALIAASDGQTMALTNGCVCCNMGDDLGDGLAAMAARIPPPEHVIVEASGVGDPWRIAQMALIEPGFTLEPLVVLVDATALPAQLDDHWTGDTVARQLAFAEIVVITKIDLADAAQLAMVHARIAQLRPQARVIETAHASLPETALGFTPPARPPASRFQADEITHAFPTQRIAADQPFDRDRLRWVLGMLPASVLRLKGVCLLGTDRVLLQYAAERWAFSPAPNGLANGLVAIGTPQMPDLELLFSEAR
ncbi:MAG: GTP-binding protein [Acetobacteraceae bacterium]|nr:GTP-binding protein [Acetobacteraceae bacterium]